MKIEEDRIHGWENLFSAIHIQPITFDAIPANVASFFSEYKQQYFEQRFDQVFLVDETSGFKHIVALTSIFEDTAPGKRQEGISVEVVNLNTNDEIVGTAQGYLKLTNKGDLLYDNQPLVTNTQSYEGYMRKRLATRRLLLLNYFFTMMNTLPLRSSKVMSYEARKVWEKLHEKSLVEVFMENDQDEPIYRFIK